MKGIVWGRFLTHAVKQLEAIENNYAQAKIPIIKKILGHTQNYIIFENGDRWDAVVANESQRGRAANISYIESTIPDEIIKTIIFPCTKALPFTAIHSFDYEPPIQEKEE